MTSSNSPENAKEDLGLEALSNFEFGTAWDNETPHWENSPEYNKTRERRFSSKRTPRPRRTQRFRSEGENLDDNGEEFRAPRNKFERRSNKKFSKEQGTFRSKRPNRPEIKPDFTITFYPEDSAFQPIAEMMLQSGKTYEMFRVAQSFLSRPERFVFVLKKKPEAEGKFYFTAFDDIPFSTREAALEHLIEHHLNSIFEIEDIKVEAPKGTFLTVHRCPFTKKIIAAPNSHLYRELLAEHYQKVVRNLPFEDYCARLEVSHDEQDIQTWVEQMKHQKIYRLKADPNATISETAKIESASQEEIADSESQKIEEKLDSENQSSAREFHSEKEIREYLSTGRPELIREIATMRVKGTTLANITDSVIRHAVENELKQQLKFPLDTCSAMRQKWRSAGLNVYKRGKRGISFICAIRRKFRDSKTVFSPELEAVIQVLDQNNNHTLSELLEIAQIPEAEHEAWIRNLSWLIHEGYVSEFEDGKLMIYPPLPEAKKEENSTTEDEETLAEEDASLAETQAEATENSNPTSTEE